MVCALHVAEFARGFPLNLWPGLPILQGLRKLNEKIIHDERYGPAAIAFTSHVKSAPQIFSDCSCLWYACLHAWQCAWNEKLVEGGASQDWYAQGAASNAEEQWRHYCCLQAVKRRLSHGPSRVALQHVRKNVLFEMTYWCSTSLGNACLRMRTIARLIQPEASCLCDVEDGYFTILTA